MRRRLLIALVLTLLGAASARALVIDSGQPNTTPPPDGSPWSHVGRVDGPTGVYLGNGWVLTAAHVPSTSTNFGGVDYPPVPGSDVILENPDESLADLRLFRIDPSPSLGILDIRASTPPNNTAVTLIGRGVPGGVTTTWTHEGTPYEGWEWGVAGGTMRWGTNRVAGTANIGTLTIMTSFTESPGMGYTTHEAQGTTGDSGGAVFAQNGGDWELAGVMLAIGPGTVPSGQPWNNALYGNLTFSADLSQYRDQIIDVVRPECSNEVDDDGDLLVDWPYDPECDSELDPTELPDQDADGAGDPVDNCLEIPNPDQRDTNQDGYGNLCDTDIDDNGATGVSDFLMLKASFGSMEGEPAYDPNADFDGNTAVGVYDFLIFSPEWGHAPGPSGYGCAGSIPCP
jgi:hypothetical protein